MWMQLFVTVGFLGIAKTFNFLILLLLLIFWYLRNFQYNVVDVVVLLLFSSLSEKKQIFVLWSFLKDNKQLLISLEMKMQYMASKIYSEQFMF